jgi:uncharacterized paraquat-inducible protein A
MGDRKSLAYKLDWRTFSRVYGARKCLLESVARLSWEHFLMVSPAYRVTAPCVTQLAYMRQKQLARFCQDCHTPNTAEAKFCCECGAKLYQPFFAKRLVAFVFHKCQIGHN